MATVSKKGKQQKQPSMWLSILGGLLALAIIVVLNYAINYSTRSDADPNYDEVYIGQGTAYYDTTGFITVLSFGLTYEYGDNAVAEFMKVYQVKTKMAVNVYETDEAEEASFDCQEGECVLFVPLIEGPMTISYELLDAILQAGRSDLGYERRVATAMGTIYALMGESYGDYVDEMAAQCNLRDVCDQIPKSEYEDLKHRLDGKSLPLKVYKNGILYNPDDQEVK